MGQVDIQKYPKTKQKKRVKESKEKLVTHGKVCVGAAMGTSTTSWLGQCPVVTGELREGTWELYYFCHFL